MMVIAAILFGVMIMCLTWVTAHRHTQKHILSHRIAMAAGTLTFPFSLRVDSKNRTGKPTIAFDEAKQDTTARNLFLAGYRNHKQIQFFRFIIQAGFILPGILVIIYLVTDSFTVANLLRAGAVGAGFLAYVHGMLYLFRRKRQKKIARVLPNFFDLLIVCLESGLNFTSALPRVIQELDPKEPLCQEFAQMHSEFLGGIPLAKACERLSERCEVSDLSVVLNSIIQSDKMGISLGNTLRIQSKVMREKYRQRMQEKARKIPVLIIFPTILIFSTLFTMTLGPAFYRLNSALSEKPGQKEAKRSGPTIIKLHATEKPRGTSHRL